MTMTVTVTRDYKNTSGIKISGIGSGIAIPGGVGSGIRRYLCMVECDDGNTYLHQSDIC